MQAAQDRYNRGKVYHAGAPDGASKDYQSMQQQAAECAVGDGAIHVGDAGRCG